MANFKDALKRSVPAVPAFAGKKSGASKAQNPFNTKVTKPKFQILNRFERGATGNIVKSKTKANSVRAATLLPQLKELKRAHTSSFVDRRFGERDRTMSKEEVMQERFAREQQRIAKKQSRKSKFDLNKLPDDGDFGEYDDFSLTHGGRSIAQMDDEELEDYDEYQLDDDDDDEVVGLFGKTKSFGGNLDRSMVSRGHFGGFEDEAAPKSKQEIMKELIAKSKYYKHERQKIKEENEAMTEDLNAMFSEIRANLHVLSEDDRRRLRDAARVSEAGNENPEDDYESVLKDLTFDPRSRPTDRTMRPEEKTQLDRERSEAQEKAMLARMLPEEERKKRAARSVEDVDGAAFDCENGEEESTQDLGSAAPIDPELIKIAKRQAELMKSFCKAETVESAQQHYAELVQYARKQARTMIQLARAIRAKIGHLSTAFTDRCNQTGRGTFMPAASSLRLLLLVSRIFSCSDFHHVVSTPAQLLLAYYLSVGRMTKMAHVQRALGLAYLATQFQQIGRRCIPEALEVLFTILSAGQAGEEHLRHASHYFRRPMSRGVIEVLSGTSACKEEVDPSALLFGEQELGPEMLLKVAQDLSIKLFDLLEEGEYPALKEALQPFTLLSRCPSHLQEMYSNCSSSHASLQLQNHKPLALPMLTPDFDVDYSVDGRRRERDESNDQRSLARLKAAHKREYKGAVRELKRDAAFLAEHEIAERRAKDAAYKARMNQIIGSIGNEGADPSAKKKSRK